MALPAEDNRWKEKYLASIDQLDQKEKHWKHMEELLRLGMNRVALAAHGVDDGLDRDLEHLRKTIRRGKAYDGLEAIVNSISVSVKRLDEKRKQHTTQSNPQLDLVKKLLESLQLPGKFKKKITRLNKAVNKLSAEHSADAILNEVIEVTNTAVQQLIDVNSESNGKLSWMQKLFGDKNDSDITIQDPTHKETEAVESDKTRAKPVAETAANGHSKTDNVDIIRSLLDKLPRQWMAEDQTKKLKTALAHVDSQDKLEKLLDAIIKSIQLEHATTANKQQASTERASNLPRQSTDATSDEMIVVEKFCLTVLETLHFPMELQYPVDALRNRVVSGVTESEIPGVLKAISDLIVATRNQIENEKRDLQEFLLQLTDNLADIDNHLGGAKQQFDNSRQVNVDFNDNLDNEMLQLENSVQQANDLSPLKRAIETRLKAIRGHLNEHRTTEQQHQTALALALSNSTKRLHDLEVESQELKERITKEHAAAVHDALTGIHNRLAYEEHIVKEFGRWKRYKKPLVMLIFDIDNFKAINDGYGHKAGDKALRLIAKSLMSNLRESDFLARYGGEEFIVIMPETDIVDAMKVAEKLRHKISEIKFHFKETSVPITVSGGAAQFSGTDSINTVFQRADQSLYQAKEDGRNQCYTADQ